MGEGVAGSPPSSCAVASGTEESLKGGVEQFQRSCCVCLLCVSAALGLHTTTQEFQTCISGSQGPPREGGKNENNCGRGEKSAKIWVLHPFKASTLRGPRLWGPFFFQVWASTFRGPSLWGHHFLWFEIGRSKLAEVEIGEVEMAELEKKSWPKSKLAEVDRAPTNRMRSFQAALKILGPEEKAVREGLDASLQRAIAEAQKPSVQQRISLTPDFVVAAACEKVAKLERVMGVLQGTTGEEVDAIKIALDRARVAAQEIPLTEQIADCNGFVERAQKRLVKLEAERDAENALLEEGRARLALLEAQAAARVVGQPPPAPTAVSDLEAEVSRLKAELAATRAAVVDPDCQDPDPKRPCRREEFIPNCDEEMQEWMEDRHKDQQEAMVAGRLSEVARVSRLLTKAAQEWQELIQQQSLMPSAVANSVR